MEIANEKRLRTLVVTGADSAHYGLAGDLATSLREHYGSQYQFAFLNFSPTTLPYGLPEQFDTVVDVSTDYHLFDATLGYYAAFIAAKARLPELFPDYDCYCWIDSDCWFQGSQSLPRILQCVENFDICIHPEYDPHYFMFSTPNVRTIEIYTRNEPQLDVTLLHRPMFNTGVFAMMKSSKVWPLWQAALADLRNRHKAGENVYFSDQIPLHRILHTLNISIFPLRAIDNWQIYASTPRIDQASKTLCVPTPPYETIGLVHLAGYTKDMILHGEGGQNFTMRYSDMRDYFDGREPAYARALLARIVSEQEAADSESARSREKRTNRWKRFKRKFFAKLSD